MSKVLELAKNRKSFEIKNKSATKAEIYLYGAIGSSWFDDSISAKQFSEAIQGLSPTVNEIVVRINSPGGDVFDGIAIYNRLKSHSAKKTIYIDGLAASIASIIALAGDEIIMGEGALYMVHLPWTVASGDRNDLDAMINRLLDIEEQLVSIYQNKCKKKKTRAEIRAMMEEETWMDSSQAIAEGFADSVITDSVPIAASVLDNSKWIHKVPKNITTLDNEIRKEVDELKSKVEEFLARK